MDIEIRKLTPDDAEAYVRFFDETSHDNDVDEHKCYCVCWSNMDYEGADFSSRQKRRAAALQYVREGNIQGYLAYKDGKIVGWCNANTKADCLKCCSWRIFMGYAPIDDMSKKVKSIFCFVVVPKMKRMGIAALLLKRVCDDAMNDSFDYVEAYPYSKGNSYHSSDFGGYLEMYEKVGFTIFNETESGTIVRKQLK
jgi:GNAT superfamily N-acetyltransferase